jgi:menaquinone-9 beta-reductase
MPDPRPATTCDVTVIGGGLAGKAASLHLAKAGLKVICIDPSESARQPVGESLDWSGPDLLKELGLPMEDVVGVHMGTWKRHVILKLPQGSPEDYVPVSWLGEAPFHVELRTLHVDRTRLDEELRKKVIECGVTLVRDKVVRVERNGKRISCVHTAAGKQFSSPWFIDASGFATSLLAREFNLRAICNGPPKVALWTYFAVNDAIQGTTIYMEPKPAEYLDWIWEIPIRSAMVSVGYVTTAEAMKRKRQQGLSVDDIFRQELLKFPRFSELLESGSTSPLSVTSFRSRIHVGVTGPNWFITGEAGAMVDPITSNGVTAALRHAADASRLIVRYHKRSRVPLRARICYGTRMRQVALFFNSGIENVVYQPPVRNRIGMRHSGTTYIGPAWTMNLVYARVKPDGIFSTFAITMLLGFIRSAEWIFYRLCKLFARQARLSK